MPLNLAPRLQDPDALFAALVQAHETLDDPTSRQLDAALILLLANHIGDDATVLEAIRTARRSTSPAIDSLDQAGAAARRTVT